jgi:hypothetical protein
LNHQKPPAIAVPRRLEAPTPSLINMAHIKVEGIGGLGMVAAVVAVAIADPRIRLATIIALGLGAGLAWLLIAIRRQNGGMPWNGDGTDSQFTLRIDSDERRAHRATVRGAIDQARAKPTGLQALPHFNAG